jgi:chromosomal replication initiation ATPase DnaA
MIQEAVKDVKDIINGSANGCRTFKPDVPLYHASEKVNELCSALSDDASDDFRSRARKIALDQVDQTLKGPAKQSARQKIMRWFEY